MENELPLATQDDWGLLRERGLTTVIDPMIYRAGELFCAGRGQAYDPSNTWQALSANLAGIAAFFDAIIYNDQLPIFDYDITFPEGDVVGLGASYRLVAGVNLEERILVPVRVQSPVYVPIKEAALAELEDRPTIDPELRLAMLSEMSAFRYAWEPTLTGTEDEDPDERRLSILLFGGLPFSGYAHELRGAHLLQPKRAKLFGEIAFDTAADDAALYARMAELPDAAPEAVSHAMELPSLPSFLPYLLQQHPRTPHELLRSALALRTDRNVRAYREWRDALVGELTRGENARAKRAQIDAIHSKLSERFSAGGVEAKLSVATTALAIPVPKIELAKSAQVRPRAAWGWCLRKIRGDHQKILTRLIGAQDAFSRLDLALGQIWHAG